MYVPCEVVHALAPGQLVIPRQELAVRPASRALVLGVLQRVVTDEDEVLRLRHLQSLRHVPVWKALCVLLSQPGRIQLLVMVNFADLLGAGCLVRHERVTAPVFG